jgi:hypothetical protein
MRALDEEVVDAIDGESADETRTRGRQRMREFGKRETSPE